MLKGYKTNIFGVLALALASIVLGFVVWKAVLPDEQKVERHVTFHRLSAFSEEDVTTCLKFGNGEHVFEKYKKIGRTWSLRDYPSSIFVDGLGARLIITTERGMTSVKSVSIRPLSHDERDLLNWCVDNPETTWIPGKFR